METKQAVENALINTYRHIKAKPGLRLMEIAGLFVNFYYQQLNVHHGLNTSDFSVIRKDDKVIIFAVKESHWHQESLELSKIFSDMTPANFYSLFLRASFENPNEYYAGQAEARSVISVEAFISARQKELEKAPEPESSKQFFY